MTRTFRHTHQLAQLKRLDPATAAEAEALLPKFPANAARLITKAMQRALTTLTTTPFDRALYRLEAALHQGIPLFPGKERHLCHTPHGNVTICRRQDDRLCLVIRKGGLPVVSKPLAYWGRDDNNISSPQVGTWKLYPNAEVLFAEWCKEVGR